jgi:hypothetical protein
MCAVWPWGTTAAPSAALGSHWPGAAPHIQEVVGVKVLVIVAALILAVSASYAGGVTASKGAVREVEVWLPIHVPGPSDKWASRDDGQPAWSAMYAKQYDQTAFRVCGYWQGHGEALLAYPGAGDPVPIEYDTPTPMCITTSVAKGGGEYAHPLQVYLRSDTPQRAVTVRSPNVFVLTQ